MTVVNIDVKDLGGIAHHDDRVTFRAPNHRVEGDQVVSTAAHTVMLVDGIGSTNLSPGPAVVRLHCQGVSDNGEKQIVVPEDGPVALAELLEGAFTYTPAVVSRVARDAAAAAAAADRAEGVADAFGSLEGVVDQVQAASDAAVSATSSAAAASMSAASANDSQVSAASSATAAAQSAVNAADSERVAGEHKGAAESAAAGAVLSADDAATSAGDAEDSASAASSSASTAGDHAAAASGHAQAALEEADRSSSEADRAEAAAQSASTGVQPDTVGRLHLTPGLRGEIDGKAAASHQHSWPDVTDKPSAYPPESHSHTSSQISDATATGRSVLTAVDAAAARTAIGAGTSSLKLGTTSSTAARGDHTHTPASIGAAPASHTHSEYAEESRVTALEDNAPIVVSSLPSSPLPGRIYLVTG